MVVVLRAIPPRSQVRENLMKSMLNMPHNQWVFLAALCVAFGLGGCDDSSETSVSVSEEGGELTEEGGESTEEGGESTEEGGESTEEGGESAEEGGESTEEGG